MARQYSTDKEMEASDALQNMVKVLVRECTIFDGVITDVDPVAFTCTVHVGDSVSGVDFGNVILETLINESSSFILIPAKNSPCIMAFRDANPDRRQIIKAHNIDKIVANPNTLFQFGDGTNLGIPMVTPTVAKINALENDINSLKELIAGWVVAPGDGGGALKAILATWFAQTLPVTIVDDLQNKKVTQ